MPFLHRTIYENISNEMTTIINKTELSFDSKQIQFVYLFLEVSLPKFIISVKLEICFCVEMALRSSIIPNTIILIMYQFQL